MIYALKINLINNHYFTRYSNLIDIGCGDGNFIEYLNKKKYFKLHATELASSEKNKFIILYCVTNYPANFEDFNL